MQLTGLPEPLFILKLGLRKPSTYKFYNLHPPAMASASSLIKISVPDDRCGSKDKK